MLISVMAIQLCVATPLWEQCAYNSLKGFWYCVLQVQCAAYYVTQLLTNCSAIIQLLTYNHLHHSFNSSRQIGIYKYVITKAKLYANILLALPHLNNK